MTQRVVDEVADGPFERGLVAEREHGAIDIGLDVTDVGEEGPKMRGQVILTVPGGPCMRCVGFIDDENLSDEGRRYGDAGIHPQVVWANGVLASTAVGLAVDLLTGWTRTVPEKGVVQTDASYQLAVAESQAFGAQRAGMSNKNPASPIVSGKAPRSIKKLVRSG